MHEPSKLSKEQIDRKLAHKVRVELRQGSWTVVITTQQTCVLVNRRKAQQKRKQQSKAQKKRRKKKTVRLDAVAEVAPKNDRAILASAATHHVLLIDWTKRSYDIRVSYRCIPQKDEKYQQSSDHPTST